MNKTKSIDQIPAFKKILERAKDAQLSEKAIDLITRTAETALGKMNNAEGVGENELLTMLRAGIMYDETEKARVFHRPTDEENWGESALIFLERF